MKVCEAMPLAGDALNATLSGVFGIAFLFLISSLSLQKWLLLMHLWSRDCPATDAADVRSGDH